MTHNPTPPADPARFSTGVRSAPRDALIAASADRTSRGRAFGLEGAGDNLGAFLGPLITVGLLLFLHIELRTIFYLAIFPGFLAFATVLLVRERRTAMQAKAKLEVGLSHLPGPYRRYLVATLVFGAGNSSNAFLILKTREFGASLALTVLIYAGFNLVAALVSYPAGAFADRFGRRGLLISAYTIFFLTYFGFAVAPGLDWAAGLFVLYGAFQGIFRAVGKALVSDLVPEHLRASGIGWYSAAIGLSGLIAGLVGGLLWDRVGHASVFLYGAAFAALGGAAFIALVPAGAGDHSGR